MKKSYIKLYKNEDNFLCAELHANGKYKIINTEEKMLMLKLAGLINRQDLSHEGFVRNEEKASKIIEKYEKFRKAQIRITNLGKIPNKKIVLTTLSGVLILTGANILHNDEKDKESNDISFLTTATEEAITDDNQEKIDVEEEMTATISEDNNYEISTYREKSNEQEQTFEFSYESRINTESFNNVIQYKDIFESVADDYGLDANLLMAIAAQESGGLHYENLDNGAAVGIMQIERGVHPEEGYSIYNYNTREYDQIPINEDTMRDLKSNIIMGAAIFKANLNYFDYNIPIALQSYNFGPGSMYQVLSMCSELEDTTEEELINNQTNNSWLNYREFLQTGDSEYVEHVLSYLNSDKITVLNNNGEQISVNINNTYEKGLTH